jgi:general secretion pathway protein J
MKVTQQRGFTLLEMLLALVIFSILSMSAYQVLRSVLRSSELARQHGESLSQMQFAFDWMERDLTHARIRPVRQLKVIVRPDFSAGLGVIGSDDAGIEVVHDNWINPGGMLPRSQYERVGYRLKGEELERLNYPFPDMPVESKARITPLLSGVSHFRLRYYNGQQWQTQWHASTVLPQAIEVTLTLSGKGDIRRVWMLNNGEGAG